MNACTVNDICLSPWDFCLTLGIFQHLGEAGTQKDNLDFILYINATWKVNYFCTEKGVVL